MLRGVYPDWRSRIEELSMTWPWFFEKILLTLSKLCDLTEAPLIFFK
jgi:hypothetical protein